MYRLPEYHNQKLTYHSDTDSHHPDNHPVHKHPAHNYSADIRLQDIHPVDTPTAVKIPSPTESIRNISPA